MGRPHGLEAKAGGLVFYCLKYNAVHFVSKTRGQQEG